MKKISLTLLILVLSITPALAIRVQSLEETLTSDTLVLAARVKKRLTSVTEVENDRKDPRMLSPKLFRMTSRYEIEQVRVLQGQPVKKLTKLEFADIVDPLVNFSTTASGLEHMVEEGKEYIFLAKPAAPKKSKGVVKVFRVEAIETEPQLLRVIRGRDARTSEGR